MNGTAIGVAIGGANIREVQPAIERAEELGVDAVWMTTGGARLDSITTFAATAGSTQKVKLGTSIVPLSPVIPW
jgi:alkanesulfonate monooxygenase SsuD/methylene tetrahydromethanopterin reductase-like flavin-dependent oxidoreductase (luciferase family)